MADCSSETFLYETLRWDVNCFTNEALLSTRLSSIPTTFTSTDHFYSQFYPFVLEEARAQLGAIAAKDFDGVRSYKATVYPSRKKSKIKELILQS